MSELTNVARPYAKAAFDYAVEQNALAAWADMLFFAAEVVKTLLSPSACKATLLRKR